MHTELGKFGSEQRRGGDWSVKCGVCCRSWLVIHESRNICSFVWENISEFKGGISTPICRAAKQLILVLGFCAITYMSGIEGSLYCSHMPAGRWPVESDLSLRKHYQLQMQPWLPE